MKTAKREPFIVGMALVLVLSAASMDCRGSGDPVRGCLDALARAARDRDTDAVFASLTSDFQSGDGSSRADAQAMVRRYLAAYENLDVTLSHVEIERNDAQARARFRAELSGQPRKIGGLDALLPRSSTYDFDVRLVSVDGEWKVSWASWQESGR